MCNLKEKQTVVTHTSCPYTLCNLFDLTPLPHHSAYTEAYNVCSVAVSPLTGSVADVRGETAGEEDQGRTSDEEDGGADSNYNRQVSFR